MQFNGDDEAKKVMQSHVYVPGVKLLQSCQLLYTRAHLQNIKASFEDIEASAISLDHTFLLR